MLASPLHTAPEHTAAAVTPGTAAPSRRHTTSTSGKETLICMHSTVRSSSVQQSEQSAADGSPGPDARRAAVRPCWRARGAMCSGAAWHGTDLVERRLVVVERPRLLAASGFVSAAALLCAQTLPIGSALDADATGYREPRVNVRVRTATALSPSEPMHKYKTDLMS